MNLITKKRGDFFAKGVHENNRVGDTNFTGACCDGGIYLSYPAYTAAR